MASKGSGFQTAKSVTRNSAHAGGDAGFADQYFSSLLGGLIDTGVLRNLVNVRSPNSRAWLIKLLLEKVSEANYSESLGAVIALGWILPDDHPTYSELLQWLLSCPTSHQRQALSAWNNQLRRFRSRTVEQLSFWVLVEVVKIAAGEQWPHLNEQGKKDIYGILFGHNKYIARACEVAGIDPKLANLISAVFDREIENDGDFVPYQLGPIQGRLYGHNWTTCSLPPRVQEALLECREVKASGLFQIVLALLRFSKKMDFDGLQGILELLPEGQEYILGAIPQWLVGLMPCHGQHYLPAFDCTHLRAMNIGAFNQLIDERDLYKWPPFMDDLFIEGSDVEVAGLERLFEHMPSVGVNIFFDNSHRHFGISEVQVEQGFSLAKQTILKSEFMAKRHFLSWGVLYKKDPSSLQQLKDLVKRAGCSGADHVHGQSEIFPFPIDIDDGYSLCLLAKGIVHCFDYSHDKEWSDVVLDLSNNIRLFGLTAELLTSVAADVGREVITRAASQLLSIICADDVSTKNRLIFVLQDIPQIQALINDETAAWYVEGLCKLMQRELGENVPSAIAAAEALLEVAREKVEIRGALSGMLSVWREASSSPVHATQSMQKWLDE